MSGWLLLYTSIFLEILGTLNLKISNGFERWPFGVLALCFIGTSFFVFSHALKAVPLGVAYALWSGIGTVTVVCISMLFFREPATLLKIVFIMMIVCGCIGLNLISYKGGNGSL